MTEICQSEHRKTESGRCLECGECQTCRRRGGQVHDKSCPWIDVSVGVGIGNRPCPEGEHSSIVTSGRCSTCGQCIRCTALNGEAHARSCESLLSSMVDHPAHYGGVDNPHEHVKCATAAGLVTNAFLYNCTKYIWRYGKKGGYTAEETRARALEDLRKARWYLDRAIQEMEK